MRSLYIRIWLTVIAALALFALASGWLLERHLSQERARADALLSERLAGWGPLIQGSLPPNTASQAEQAAALEDWAHRMHTPLALLDATGRRIAASQRYLDIEAEGHGRPLTVPLEDGRKLSIMRPDLRMLPLRRLPPEVAASGPQRGEPRLPRLLLDAGKVGRAEALAARFDDVITVGGPDLLDQVAVLSES